MSFVIFVCVGGEGGTLHGTMKQEIFIYTYPIGKKVLSPSTRDF